MKVILEKPLRTSFGGLAPSDAFRLELTGQIMMVLDTKVRANAESGPLNAVDLEDGALGFVTALQPVEPLNHIILKKE